MQLVGRSARADNRLCLIKAPDLANVGHLKRLEVAESVLGRVARARSASLYSISLDTLLHRMS